MQAIARLLDNARLIIRSGSRLIAALLDKISGGKLKPDHITYISLLGHLPVAWLIVSQQFIWASILLIIFGLMDTLDGELARLQKRASPAGMLLDASTDRMKESLIYIAAAYALVQTGSSVGAVWAVAACSGALLVSYVKAKGEAAVSSLRRSNFQKVNRLFQDGLMRYEIRMLVVIVGLLSDQLLISILVVAILSWFSAIGRLQRINKYLRDNV